MISWMAVATASAEPCHLDPATFGEFLTQADAALDADDAVAHGAVWRDLQARLPCLDGPVPAEGWSRFLVGLALLEHTVGLPTWQQPLQVAIEIDPDVPRAVGTPEFRAFVPTRPPDPGPPLPADAEY
jgi:hypothetical protein